MVNGDIAKNTTGHLWKQRSLNCGTRNSVVLSDHAPARDRADSSREARMFGRNIDLLWCLQRRYHVHSHWVLSFKHNEHQLTGFLPSWSMQKLHQGKRSSADSVHR